MKKIFVIYCVSYMIIALILAFGELSLTGAKILMALSILNTAFPLAAPLIVIITPGLLKTQSSDSKYMNFCLYAGLFRFLFWSCALFGLRDHMLVLFLNAFGLAIFALLESNFTRISNEYFKY